MKKTITKSFGIILSIFFAFACVLISGCGNKYKKMEFEVQYAFSSDTDVWYDADDSISLIMGEGDERIQKDAFGVGTLYIRINVSGVKAKHIDDIVVSKLASGAPNFSSVTVKEGEVFPIEIHETEKVVNSLKIYETKSKKSTVVGLEVYQELTSIEADLENNPAVMLGGSVDLNKYNNLKFLSNGREGLVGESQKEVEYSVVSVGWYDGNKVYQPANNFSSVYFPKINLENGVLTVEDSYNLSTSSYVIRVQAKSVNSEVAGEFDVYVVDNATASFDMNAKFNNREDVGSKFTLYPGSEFNRTSVTIDYTNISNHYVKLDGDAVVGLNSSFGKAKYQPVVYIDGERVYDKISSDSGIGYDVVYDETKATYTFTVFPTGKYTGYNIEIKMEIAGLDFAHASVKPEYSDKFIVDKKVLPSEIRINNDADYIADTVYLKDDKYTEIELKLNTFPLVDEFMVNNTISMTSTQKILVKYAGNNKTINSGEMIENIPMGSTLYITLDPMADGPAIITFSIQNVPSIFDGKANNVADKTFEKVFTLKGEMTAKETVVYADESCTNKVTENNPLLVDANNDTYFYVKVWAKNITSFVPNTVSIDSNNSVVFGNDKTVTTLAENVVDHRLVAAENAAIYKVKIKAGRVPEKSDEINVHISGYGLGYKFETKAVNTVSNADSIKVISGNSAVKDIHAASVDNANKYFALEHGVEGQLLVVGAINGLSQGLAGAVNSVHVETNGGYNLGDTEGKFSDRAITIKDGGKTNPIKLESNTAGKTQAFKITVSYYVSSESNLTLATKVIDIQVATYTPVKEIKLSTDKDEVVYVNQFFAKAAKTVIEIETDKNENDDNKKITTELNFDNFAIDGIAVDNNLSKNNAGTNGTVTGLKIYSNVEPSEDGKTGVSYYVIKDGVKKDLKEVINKKEFKIDSAANILNGEFYVELNDEITEEEIVISVVSTRFGVEDSVVRQIKIKVLKHNGSTEGIRLSGTNIKSEGEESNYVYMNVGEEGVVFTAEAINVKDNKYADLAYRINIVEKDTTGNIRYNENGVAYLDSNVGTDLTLKEYVDEVEYNGIPLDGKVELKSSVGGLYVMDIYALDSYDKVNKVFKNTVRLFVNVSDGTEQNPYVIRKASDFKKIEQDKHYVLGRDFNNTSQAENLINLGVVESKVFKDEVGFAGTIKGTVDYLNSSLLCNKTVRYTIKYTPSVLIDETDHTKGTIALFNSAESSARFENFDIIANYNIDSSLSLLNIAGLVNQNAGTIKNVGVTINNSTIVSTGAVNYGALAGTNNGTIDLGDSAVLVKTLEIKNIANGSNIGMVAATNAGEIKADYNGIDSFDTLNFDVMVNVIVNTENATEDGVNIAGIAGSMDAGSIKNILVGGKIQTNSAGNLAGISAVGEGEINTVATFALDLTGTGSSLVAGIVAKSNGVEIENVRVESALVEFTSLGISAYGKISGAGTSVAGIVAESHTSDTITYAAVESFIDTIGNDTYYMIENTSASDVVYGIAKGGSSVGLSFVDANIAGGNITLTSNATTEINTYFVGNINKDFANDSNYTTKATYAVLYNETNKVVCVDPSPLDSDTWSIDGNYNSVRGKFVNASIDNEEKFVANKDKLYTEDGGIYTKLTVSATYDSTKTYYIFDLTKTEAYPYLLKDGKPFMIIRPTGLNANLKESKLEELNSIYISESQTGIVIKRVDFEYTTDDIDEIVIINYLNDANNPLNNVALNTYKITDLVSAEVVPPEATGAIMFKIVEGGSFARIENNTNIVFLGVGGKNPIIVKVYSVINTNLVKYIVFYTEYGYTNVTIKGNNIETEVGADGLIYTITINTAPTSSAERIEIDAENLKDDFYTNIFDANNDAFGTTDFIEISPNKVGQDEVNAAIIDLKAVAPNNLTAFNLKYNQNEGFDNNKAVVEVYFDVKINLTKYFGEAVFPKQGGNDQYYTLKTVKLKVTVVKTATSLTITNKPSKITTDSALTFNATMETGYFGDKDKDSVNSDIENNTVVFDEVNKDSMYFTITPEAGYEQRVLNLLKQANLVNKDETECKNIPSLFENFDIKYVIDSKDGKNVGYTYSIKTNFVNEYNYRYITEDLKFRFDVYSAFNESVKDSFVVTIKPTALDSAEIKNYTVSSMEEDGDDGVYTLYEVEKSDSYVISPGHRGGIMVINLEPSYANLDWDKVTFTSTPLYVPDLGKEVYLTFEQVALNRQTGKYETVPYNDYHYDTEGKLKDIFVSDGDKQGIKLFPYSEINGIDTRYTGKIYVYVGLTHFAGLRETISAELKAYTTENDAEKLVKQEVHLLTQYLPGVSISYSGNKLSDGYLIQENTSNNALNVKLYGYEFNAKPEVTFTWQGTQSQYKEISVASQSELDKLLPNGLWIYDDGAGKYKRSNSETYDSTQKYYACTSDFISYYIDENIVRNTDGSTSIKVYINVEDELPSGFEAKIGLSLIMDDGQTLTQSNAKIKFYPVDYILRNIVIGDVHTVVNTNNKLDINFDTNSLTNDYSDVIYDKLIRDMVSGTDASLLMDAFTYNYKGNVVSFYDVARDGNELYPEFDIKFLSYTNVDGKIKRYLTIQTKNTIVTEVKFTINYGYEDVDGNGTYELVFNKDTYTYTEIFNLRIDSTTTEDNAIPIDNAEKFVEFMKNGKGQDFILTNDIVLEDYTPIATEIASLDGNNKIIKIKNFAVSPDATANYGLFASFGTCTVAETVRQSILKNVVVDYSELQDVVSTIPTTQIVFGGLVANNNGGLIYNCDVMNLSTVEKTINVYFDGSTRNHKVIFGGLVGINKDASFEGISTQTFKGTITNSRVGRDGFKKISVDTYGNVSESNIPSSKIKFVVGYSNTDRTNMNGFVGITGAFAGENHGIIASSYVSNTSLINYSTAPINSKTAGFVAENSGRVAYSYIQADPSTLSSTNPYAKGAQIESITDGRVAGFVFTNNGEVENSYANTVLVSHSNFMSGFAFENEGLIKESYSACTLNAIGGSDTSEQPFIGSIDGITTLSTGEIENSYYYKDSKNFNTSATPIKHGKNQATGLSLSNFRDSEMLYGFVFVLANNKTESEQGVWSYYTQDNKFRLLPELTSTNIISTSYRYLTDSSNEDYEYTNAIGYEQGGRANPYIIRSVEEYSQVMTANGAKKTNYGYIRFISDINFTGKDVSTHANFVLGDATNRNITSIDGNGMTLSGLYLDAPSKDIESIGMFAEIQNSYIKNLNLKFDKALYSDKFSSISVKYSGGLAGKINNSVIINITLDGKETTLAGSNAVGGLAGIITGNSLIYGIDSNLSVIATEHDTKENYYIYYSEEEFRQSNTGFGGSYSDYISNLCYAGGLAGIIDIYPRGNELHNISYINIKGSEMTSGDSANISGDYVGGVAGFAGKGTSSFKLKYYTGSFDKMSAGYTAGGLYGISMGKMLASQVTAFEGTTEDQLDTQYAYDTEFGSYIIGIKDNAIATLNKDGVGNLSLISSTRYAGGLIGIGINAEVSSSYSKASFKSSQIVGGLIGVSVSSKILYSYAVTYVNVDLDTINSDGINDTDGIALQKVGGLIGVAYGNTSDDRSILNDIDADSSNDIKPSNEWFKIFDSISTADRKAINATDVQFAFSTLLVDHTLFETTGVDNIKFDYVSPDFMPGENTRIKSGNEKNLLQVYAGLINYNKRYLKGITCLGAEVNAGEDQSIGKVDLHTLYDVDYVDHLPIFNRIFSMWPTKYWTINPDRYFPLLIDQEPIDYIEINDATDIYKLINNPDGNFIVKADIDMIDYHGDTFNSIVKKPFTGTIIGDVENLKRIPAIYNITIVGTTEGSNVGFFASAKNAMINNLIFCYGTPSISGITLTSHKNKIGGVVATDENSTISNVSVWAGRYQGESKLDKENIYNLVNDNSKKVATFGGIVGDATNTTIIGCDFNADLTITMNNSDKAYFGGLVGRASYEDNAEDFETIEGFTQTTNMIISSSKVSKTNFNISYSSDAHIGGAVGDLNSALLTDVEVSSTFTLNSIGGESIDFGGLVGLADNTQNKLSIKSNDVKDFDLTVKTDSTTVSHAKIAGLIGYYSNSSPETEIYASNSDANIKFDAAKINSLYVSQGIAEIKAETIANLRSCLFAGSIGFINDEDSDIKNIHAAGAVAFSSAKTLDLQEIMTTTDIIAGSKDATLQFISGGLIGQAEYATIKYSVATGRIVPTTAKYQKGAVGGETDTIILIGGLAGWIKNKTGSNTDIMNSYTTTSIITDCLADDVLQGYGEGLSNTMNNVVRINALFGVSPYVVDDVSNVFYSTDYALAPEDSKLGTNLSANSFVYDSTSKDVYNGVTSNGAADIWTMTKSNNPSDQLSQLPFISSLTSTLCNYGILTEENGLYKYNIGIDEDGVKVGSSLQPIIIGQNDYDFDSDNLKNDEDEKLYLYFLISSTLNDLKFYGSLNGILIGAEVEYTINAELLNDKDNNKIYGVVPHVSKGSAVSNLHITLGVNPSAIDLNGKENIGFIVGDNEGTVSNCSTQGIGINFTNASKIGMITNVNKGVVSYSYSSVEVLSGQSTIISGITYNNDGKLLSNYFTGYIGKGDESHANTAAGIIYELGTDSYTYNCYVAGVIKCIKAGGNGFSAGAFTSGHTGKNNYIDQWADIKFNGNEVVQPIDTVYLMAKNTLAGNWTTIVNDTREGDDKITSYTINTGENSGFGRNYGYPIYDMNKSGQTLDNLPYYLKTGTGETQNDRENGWFKIPHLGVFSIINGIMDLETVPNLNYMLIYDVDANNKDWSSHAVGKTNSFKGVFATNSNYTLSTLSLENACIVQNLMGSGLFANVGESTIQYIKFGSMSALDNSGAIGQNAVGEVTINSVQFLKNSILTGKTLDDSTKSDVGALFGTINSTGEVSIEQFTFKDNGTPTISGAYNAGLIAAKMSSGKLVLDATSTDKSIDIPDYFVKFNNCVMAGGLVGTISGGNIVSKNTDIDGTYINIIISESKNNSNLGGIVGTALGGSVTNVIFVRQVSENKAETLKANTFGGLLATVGGEIEFNNCSIALEKGTLPLEDEDYTKLSIKAETTNETNQGFGFIAGKITAGSLRVNNFKVRSLKDGSYEDISSTLDVSGTTTNIYNVGGIAGLYDAQNGALVDLDEATYNYITSSATYLILLGDRVQNIGGAFGYVSGILDASKFGTEYNFLTKGDRFAKIQAISGENMGGLIGKVNGGTITGLVNSNPIEIPMFNATSSAATQFKNIGGIFGSVTDAEIGELKNKANITYSKVVNFQMVKGSNDKEGNIIPELLNIYEGAKDSGDKEFYSVRTLNVGGIAGYAQGIQFTGTGPINNGDESEPEKCEIQGYQNVGGIFGYASNVHDLSAFITANENKVVAGDEYQDNLTYFIKNVDDDFEHFVITEPAIDADNKIVGSQYYAKLTTELEQYTSMMNCGSVTGALNVGGAFGCIENGYISGAKVKFADIYGNVNVGGFAGYAPSGEYNFNLIHGEIDESDPDKSNPVNVKGIYYGITEFLEKDSLTNMNINKSKYYIPTSIGGFIGKNVKKDEESNYYSKSGATLYKNTLEYVNVSTAKEGWPSLQTDYNPLIDDSSVISTIRNNILSAEKTYEIDKGTDTPDFWDEMKSGIGGFIGTTNSRSLGSDIKTNTLTYVDINASLGINVGAYYGYFCQVGTTNTLQVPTVAVGGRVSVNGAYLVGGLVGFYDLAPDGSETRATLNQFTYNGSGSIQIQTESITGMYVGGLIGRLNGSATDIKLLSGVNIDTNGDFYIGGLFGLLEGQLTSTSSPSEWTGTVVADNIVSLGSDCENFGGLVGMLKVPDTTDTTYVQGAHNYWFTVNTVENRNYLDGETRFNTIYNNGTIYITAMAYYVNENKLEIAGTSNTDLCNNTTTGPFGNSVGWAEEYTMFKSLQRNIPQGTGDNQNPAEWDSLAIVYDASNILGVKVGDGTNSVSRYVKGEEGYKRDIANDEGYIYYTIYQDGDGSIKLYSAAGVASKLVLPDNPEDINDKKYPVKHDEYSYDLNGQYFKTENNSLVYKYHQVDDYELTEGLFSDDLGGEYNYDTSVEYDEYCTEAKIMSTYLGENCGYSNGGFLGIGSKNYLQFDYAYYKVADGECYYFDVIFGHDAILGDSFQVKGDGEHNKITFGSEGDKNGISDQNLSSSGSLFEVSGSLSVFNKVELTFWQKLWNWFKSEGWYEILIEIALIVLTWGAGAVATMLAKGMKWSMRLAKGVMKTAHRIKKIAKATAKVANRMRKLLTVATIALNVCQLFMVANPMANQTYTDPRSRQTLGFLSSTYARPIEYNDGTVKYQIDEFINGEGKNSDITYYFYSTDRPSDYYSKHTFDFNLQDTDSEEILITYPEGASPCGQYSYYVYDNGVYYINQYAGDFYWRIDQLEPTGKLYEDYVINNGFYYVTGNYSKPTYSLDSSKTALTHDADGYKVNGVPWSEVKSSYAISDEPEITKQLKFVKDNTSYEDIDGYTKITSNVRYSLYGRTIGDAKVAKLKQQFATPDPNSEYRMYRINYYRKATDAETGYYYKNGDSFELISNLPEGTEIPSETYLIDSKNVYYVAQDISDSYEKTSDFTILNKQYNSLDALNSSLNELEYIYLNMWPIEFTTNNSSLNKFIVDNEEWYLAENNEADIYLPYTAKYYWYEDNPIGKRDEFKEGSFETMSKITNTSQQLEIYNTSWEKVQVNIQSGNIVPPEEDKPTGSNINVYRNPTYQELLTNWDTWQEYYTNNLEDYKLSLRFDVNNKGQLIEILWGEDEVMDLNNIEDTIELFDSSGNSQGEKTYADIKANWNSWKDTYYTIDISTLKISKQYKKVDGKLYGYTGSNVIDGVRVELVDRAEDRKHDSWIKNKYLMGTETNFYTRYKYSRTDIFNKHIELKYDSNDDGIMENAYLVPADGSSLYNTVLIESVNITLGSFKPIYTDNNRNSSYDSVGLITMSIPTGS